MIEVPTIVQHPPVQALAWTVLHFLWQGALLGLAYFLLLRVLRPQNAVLRYAIGVTTLALMLASCAATFVALSRQPRANDALLSSLAPIAPAPTIRRTDVTGRVIADLQASPDARSLVATASERSNRFGLRPLGPLALLMIVCGWSIGVLALSFRLVGGWILTRQLTHRAVDVVSPALETAAREIAERLRLGRAVALFQSRAVSVPTLVGWVKPVVLLPAAALTGLTPQQLQAILAHELAHVRRHDCLINLLQSIVETLLFYHPVVWWVSAQVREEREHCCDDLAVEVCGDRLVYVSALAELTSLGRHPGFALAATDGSLVGRVRRLLGRPRPSHEPPPAWTSLAVFALVVAAAGSFGAASAPVERKATDVTLQADIAPVVQATAEQQPESIVPPIPPEPPVPPSRSELPAPPASPAPPALPAIAYVQDHPAPSALPAVPPIPGVPATPAPPASPASPDVTQRGSSGNFHWTTDSEKISMRWTGPFRLTDDERDIAWIEEGATVTISDGLVFASRVDLKGLSGGRIERTFSKNGFKRDYDPEGRTFLAESLEKIVRRSGLIAKDRVSRILKHGGVDAVLAEIDRIGDSSHVTRIYYSELVKQATLNDALLTRVLQHAADDLTSDFERSMFLATTAALPAVTDAHRAFVARAAKTIESDFEQRRALSAVLASTRVSPVVAGAVLEAASTVTSSYERATILSELAAKGGVTAATSPAFMDLVRGMSSSFEQRRVLAAVAAQPALPSPVVVDAVKATGAIDSSHEQSVALLAFVERGGLSDASADSFFASVAAMRSSFDAMRVLRAVVARPNLGEQLLAGVLKASVNAGSDTERATLLVNIASRYSLTGQTRELYITAARAIRSEIAENRALAALIR